MPCLKVQQMTLTSSSSGGSTGADVNFGGTFSDDMKGSKFESNRFGGEKTTCEF